MTIPVQLALMVGPLALYLYVIAAWQSGRTPRVVAGPVDFALLLFALGGVLVFGPVGRLLVVRIGPFGTPSIWAWVAQICSFGLLSLPWLPRTFRRLAVYNVEPEALDRALRVALSDLPGDFTPTLRGYENHSDHRGVIVEVTPWFRAGTIEAYGGHPVALIAQVRARLNPQLFGPITRPSRVAWVLLGLCMAMLSPLVAVLLIRPEAREAFRALIERLHGG
jgi:hypothetical protein